MLEGLFNIIQQLEHKYQQFGLAGTSIFFQRREEVKHQSLKQNNGSWNYIVRKLGASKYLKNTGRQGYYVPILLRLCTGYEYNKSKHQNTYRYEHHLFLSERSVLRSKFEIERKLKALN